MAVGGGTGGAGRERSKNSKKGGRIEAGDPEGGPHGARPQMLKSAGLAGKRANYLLN